MKYNKMWEKDSIVYFASLGITHYEEWSPKNLEKGIGGSETAVIELSKRWAKMGFRVTIYGELGNNEGIYDGVSYINWHRINWEDIFNIFILWRAPYLLDNITNAFRVFYDAHTVEYNSDWTAKRVEKVTKVFFKSHYQRRMVPSIPDSKTVILSNGITL